MALDIDNPEEELAKLERVIDQYELILKTTNDAEQAHRVKVKLKSLISFRDNLQQAFHIEKKAAKANEKSDGKVAGDLEFLNLILRQNRHMRIPKAGMLDPEMYHLRLYLKYFYEELLVVFTERKMRLDFQHSLARDGFYHRFQDVLRKLNDFEQEIVRIDEGEFDQPARSDMKQRTLRMKRVMTVEASRLLRSVLLFAKELITDIENDGTKCLNGYQRIHFDQIEGRRFLEGKTVEEALRLSCRFVTEVISYLNVPDFEVME